MEKRFKAVSPMHGRMQRKMDSVAAAAPGSYVDFNVAPTITAIRPLNIVQNTTSDSDQDSLNNPTVLKRLSSDFARSLKDMAVIVNDLQKLSTLGNLSLSSPDSSTIRVRFPGCDGDTLNQLCEELDIRRGLVHQDADFDITNGTDMALLFPFAPSHSPSEHGSSAKAKAFRGAKPESVHWQDMLSSQCHPSPGYSTKSIMSGAFEEVAALQQSPRLLSLSAYSNLNASDDGDVAAYFDTESYDRTADWSRYEGFEGVFKFLEECDRARH